MKTDRKIKKDDKEYWRLRKVYSAQKKKHGRIERRINELSNQKPELWKISEKMSALAHVYERKDVVVLRNYEIAEIKRRFGRKMYEVYIYQPLLKPHLVTMREIHEKDILKHIGNLNLQQLMDDLKKIEQQEERIKNLEEINKKIVRFKKGEKDGN